MLIDQTCLLDTHMTYLLPLSHLILIKAFEMDTVIIVFAYELT